MAVLWQDEPKGEELMAERPSAPMTWLEAKEARERAAAEAFRAHVEKYPRGEPEKTEIYRHAPGAAVLKRGLEKASLTPPGAPPVIREVALEFGAAAPAAKVVEAAAPYVEPVVRAAGPLITPVTGPVVEGAKKYGGEALEAAKKAIMGTPGKGKAAKEVAEEGVEEAVEEAPKAATRAPFHDESVTARATEKIMEGVEEAADVPRVATHFSGTGTVEGALGRHKSVHAAEIDSKAVQAYNNAHGTDYKPQDVLDVDPQEVKGADFYHASPVCKNLSCAKKGAKIDTLDQASADKVVQVIEEAEPPTLSIENVPGYQQTVLFDQISDALTRKGYTWDVGVYNAADYGGAQRRSRMIIRATKGTELPPLPEKTGPRDWFEAVEDLIDDAPDSKAANWELKRIQKAIDSGRIDPSKPIITMGGSAFRGVASAANAGKAAPTLTATAKSVPRIILPDGRVKRVTGPMMRRLMGLPDDFVIPDNWGQAKSVLGNGVHGSITESFIAPLAKQGRALRRAGKGAEEAADTAATAGEEADRYFNPEALKQWRRALNNKMSSDSLVYLTPEQFLRMAEPIPGGVVPYKAERVAKALEEGAKFEDIPLLQITNAGRVRGHEGRHRAMALRDKGVQRIPVRIHASDMRWNQQAPISEDLSFHQRAVREHEYVENLPEELVGEDGVSRIPFPFHREGPKRGQPRDMYRADARGQDVDPITSRVPERPPPEPDSAEALIQQQIEEEQVADLLSRIFSDLE